MGDAAREHALWPFVVRAWSDVKADVELGLAANPSQEAEAAVQQVDAAVEGDDYELLEGVNWAILAPLAVAGVRARVAAGMSEGVAASLDNHNATFAIAIRELLGQ